jgi:DNA replication protein DnaC
VSEQTSYQQLREHLAYLGMTAAAEQLAPELDRALAEKASPTQVLERLLGIEVEATRARRQRGRLRFARYPVYKTLADFDFDFQPSLDRKQIAELSTLRFIEEHRSIILLGPPGVGKAHLAIALGVAASDAGYRTLFTSAADMVHTLQAAHRRAPCAFVPCPILPFEGAWSHRCPVEPPDVVKIGFKVDTFRGKAGIKVIQPRVP